MSAAAIPYWELPTSWGTATTATIDVARPEEELGEGRDERRQAVFVVAPHHASAYSEPWEHVRYGIRGVRDARRVFLVEAPVSLGSFGSITELFKEPEPSLWRGFFPIPAGRKPLFSETREIQTAKLRRLRPHVSLDRRTLERENA
jgi:hypothetical protein